MQPQRLRVPDQDAEDAASMRQIADRRMRLSVDPCRQEPLERLAGPVDHSESCVAGARDLGRGLDDALQQRVERELRAERDARVDEDAKAVELVCLGAHATHSRGTAVHQPTRRVSVRSTFPVGFQR